MFSSYELRGQASYHKTGEIQLNEHYYTEAKPAWLLVLKLLGLAAMIAVGYAIAIPTLREILPLWQTIVLVAGVILVYTGIAFFVRPQPNTDNMGIAGGLANDPFQYSDDINRWLWNMHCLLGPGRFAAETLLDICVYLRIAGGEEVVNSPSAEPEDLDPTIDGSRPPDLSAMLNAAQDETAASLSGAILSPDRFARR